jgi:hypothetical protein
MSPASWTLTGNGYAVLARELHVATGAKVRDGVIKAARMIAEIEAELGAG